MQRILDPGQIEAFAQRTLPRVRLPDRDRIFSARAQRLRAQSEPGAAGHAIGSYLQLIAHLADAQQVALANTDATLGSAMLSICDSLTALPSLAPAARTVCDRLRQLAPKRLEAQADALLEIDARIEALDPAAAPFIMAALQVQWVDRSSRLPLGNISNIQTTGICPLCSSQPIASIVRSEGFRYLHCGLCATEWHMVRVKCSHCFTTQGIDYRFIEGGRPSIRAECCDACHTYRKIFYQEQDPNVEPLADDLASIALDLLLGEAGYSRASRHPFLWS